MSIRTNELAGRGVAHEPLEQRVAELEIELEPEPGQLDRDVRVETAVSIAASASP